jgi:predicted MFS family arabinose efflux permease
MRRAAPPTAPGEAASLPSDRRTFVSLGLQCVVNAFVYSTYVARLPDIRDGAGLSLAAMGVVMTIGNLSGFAAMLPSAALIRRWGSKRVMVVCSVAYVLTLPVLGSSSSPAMLVAAVVAMMVTNALVDVAVAMQSAVFSARRHYPAMSRLSGLYSLGTVGGGLLASAIVAAGFDVSVHLFVLAIVLALALVFVSPGLLPVDEAVPEREHDAVSARPWILLAVLGLASALAVPLDVVPGEWSTFRIHDDLGGASSQAALAFVAFTIGMTCGRFAGDRATARLGARRLLRGAVIVSAAGLAAAASIPIATVATVAFGFAGLGISVVSPLLTVAAGRTPGASFTAMFVGNRLAGLLTPLAMGALAGTPALSVGQAMIVLVMPSAALLLLLGAAAVSPPRLHKMR